MGLKKYFTKENSLYDNAKKTMGLNTIKGSYEDIKQNLRVITSRPEGENLSFQESVKKFNLTEEDLKNKYKTNVYIFYSMSALFALALVLFFINLIKGNYLVTFVSFVFSGVPLSKMFESSVMCYRIKHKNFLPVKKWFEDRAFVPEFDL